MPASLPGSNAADNAGNPNKGATVMLDPVSGPKGSLLDARSITGWQTTGVVGANGMPTYGAMTGPSSLSTGALCTGIGFGLAVGPTGLTGVVGTGTDRDDTGNFTSQCIPGTSLPSNVAATDARLLYIGGGLSNASGVATPRVVSEICAAGGGRYLPSAVAGSSRDGGTNQGFGMKNVIAPSDIAFGSVIVTGFINRSSRQNDVTGEEDQITLLTARAQFGSATAAAPVPAAP
jgi:hypothetical protein